MVPEERPAISNPYAAPLAAEEDAPRLAAASVARFAIQIRVIACLMVVNGLLCWLMALGYLAFGVIQTQTNRPPDDNGLADRAEFTFFTVVAIMMGAAALVGTLQIFAGIRNFLFRSYILGLVGLCSGLASILTCYCILSSFPLMIYGLIIYLHPRGRMVFKMRSEGMTNSQIISGFQRPSTEPRILGANGSGRQPN
jgi:hypothetical protein